MEDQNQEIVKKLFSSFERFSKLNWNQSPIPELKKSELFSLFSIKRLLDEKKSSVKVSDISNLLDVAPPTITQVVTSLEDKGYVERKLNKEDRRAVLVELTEKGEEAVNEAFGEIMKCFEGLVNCLGYDKSRELTELLSMVFNYFNDLNINTENEGIKT